MTDLANLPPHERARRYLGFADEADEHAKLAINGNMRDDFLLMAAGWRKLAGETDPKTRLRLVRTGSSS